MKKILLGVFIIGILVCLSFGFNSVSKETSSFSQQSLTGVDHPWDGEKAPIKINGEYFSDHPWDGEKSPVKTTFPKYDNIPF